jgi:flagellar assembly protein FliH
VSRLRPIALPVTRRTSPPTWLATISSAAVGATPVWNTPQDQEEDTGAIAAATLERERLEVLARAEAEGRARGEAAASEQRQQAAARSERLLAGLVDVRRAVLADAQQQLIDLALCVAGAVLNRELRLDRGDLAQLVREAVAMVSDGDEIEIRVAPVDRDPLASQLAELTRDNPRAGTLLITSDEKIDGGCIVETRLARVDATLASRLRNIADSLKVEA